MATNNNLFFQNYDIDIIAKNSLTYIFSPLVSELYNEQ